MNMKMAGITAGALVLVGGIGLIMMTRGEDEELVKANPVLQRVLEQQQRAKQKREDSKGQPTDSYHQDGPSAETGGATLDSQRSLKEKLLEEARARKEAKMRDKLIPTGDPLRDLERQYERKWQKIADRIQQDSKYAERLRKKEERRLERERQKEEKIQRKIAENPDFARRHAEKLEKRRLKKIQKYERAQHDPALMRRLKIKELREKEHEEIRRMLGMGSV